VAPPDAGLIRLQVPDQFAVVSFDGQQTSSVGTTRTYVTPLLEAGKTYHYKVTASWGQAGQQVTQEKTVDVARGQISTVDFTAGMEEGRQIRAQTRPAATRTRGEK
jgi:uncharacterized protein (TIGR03000 family)